ncbi:hypothetical protein BH24ACT5_BH24ACT5_09750 [soil metagenome]
MQVAVHAAELLRGFAHAGGAPAQRHLAVAPDLHVARQIFTLEEWSQQMPVIDSIAFVDRNDRANVGATPRRATVSVSARPSRNELAAPGCDFSSDR